MAGFHIAGAPRAGKSVFDRAKILSTAHANARRRMAPSPDHRFGDRWHSDAGAYVPAGLTYRQAFAAALRWAWREAKIMAEDAAWEAAQSAIPEDVAARVAAIRADAWLEPISAAGNARYRALFHEAAEIEAAARIAA